MSPGFGVQVAPRVSKRSGSIFLTTGTLILASVCLGCKTEHLPRSLPEDAYLLQPTWQKSNDAQTQQDFYYDFMWRSFIALNWPNVPIVVEDGKIVEGFRGQPIAEKDLILQQRGSGPLQYISVWETYREPAQEVFLPASEWANYPEWNTPRPVPPEAGSARPVLGYNNGAFVEYATDVNQPDFFPNPTGPLIDQNGNIVRYEVAVNQAFFTYVRHFRYFEANAQVRAVYQTLRDGVSTTSGFQPPPHGTPEELETGYLKGLPAFAQQGLIDVKAAWRVLDVAKGDKPERYLHREIYTGDGQTMLMGLVALHILRFTPDGQVASTFEQVDNLTGDSAAGVKASFNDGSTPSAIQQSLGFQGAIPKPIGQGQLVPHDLEPVSIYRVTPLPAGVQKANAHYQKLLEGSVFQFYELIGTQNKRPGVPLKVSFDTPEDRALNGHQGPVSGVFSNTNNLINAALESYTQANHSCLQCHFEARPLGVPTQGREIDTFKTLTFLLQAAQSTATLAVTSENQAFLGVGEYLVSENRAFFAIMQANGQLCVFEGNEPENQGAQKLCLGQSLQDVAFFASIQADGQFCISRGVSPQKPGETVWCTREVGAGTEFFLKLQDDGALCVFAGTPDAPGEQIWCAGTATAAL